jgi:hypothetical protein
MLSERGLSPVTIATCREHLRAQRHIVRAAETTVDYATRSLEIGNVRCSGSCKMGRTFT